MINIVARMVVSQSRRRRPVISSSGSDSESASTAAPARLRKNASWKSNLDDETLHPPSQTSVFESGKGRVRCDPVATCSFNLLYDSSRLVTLVRQPIILSSLRIIL